MRIRNALRIHSFELGLVGIADVVEFHRAKDDDQTAFRDAYGSWILFPIEYKHGAKRIDALPYNIQLCAQALCLEEMMKTTIKIGALFWGCNRRRQLVEFDFDIRQKTVVYTEDLRNFINNGKTPPPIYGRKCKGCSMLDICMPAFVEKKNVKRYMQKFFSDISDEDV